MLRTMITAHNGADKTPENSMEFVRHALASDADAFEIDIRRMPGGTLVFTHDLPDACAGGSAPASLVAIREVFLAAAGSGKLINCDLKEEGIEDDVYALAEECGVTEQLIYTGSVSAAHCLESGLTNKVRIWLNIEEYVPDLYARCERDPGQIIESSREISAVCRKYGIRCVNANYHLATEGFIAELARNDIALSVWTVNDLSQAKRLLGAGVQNLTTRNLREILSL